MRPFTSSLNIEFPRRPANWPAPQSRSGRAQSKLGAQRSAAAVERDSRNTWENALFSRRLVQPHPGETWILVTSAFHMPRAVGIFRKLDWPVIPWPVGYKTQGGIVNVIDINLPHELRLLDLAVHEWAGLVTYHLLDRTSAFYPAP